MRYIDTHAHIYGEEFSEDLDEVVARAKEAGAIKIFLPSTDAASAQLTANVAGRYPGVCYPMLGLHPEDVDEHFLDELGRLLELLRQPNHPYIAIGEVGLDYYWKTDNRTQQLAAFDVQTQWAVETRLPLMVHARKAQRDLVNSLKPYRSKGITGVFHCFTGSVEEARELLRFEGFMLGIGGVLTFKNAHLVETLRAAVPLNRIVVETDAPYMAPVPHRGKRNEPAYVTHVIDKLAEIYGTEPDAVADITTANALAVFPRCCR